MVRATAVRTTAARVTGETAAPVEGPGPALVVEAKTRGVEEGVEPRHL